MATPSSSSSSHLKFFYGEGCPFTAKAEPSVNCLDLFLSMQQAAGSTAPKMERLEVYKNEANREKYMQAEGAQNCGGVPYFYNEKTGSSVCGAAPCELLKMLATSTTKFQK